MSTEPLLSNLSMRDLLIEHLDGTPVTLVPKTPIDEMTLGERHALGHRRQLIGNMITRGYLKTRRAAEGPGYETVITEKGRGELARALADWADAIVRAAEHPTTPLQPPVPTARMWWLPK